MKTIKQRLDDMCENLSEEKERELRSLFNGQPNEEAQEDVLWEYLRRNYPVRIGLNDDDIDTLTMVAAYSGMSIKTLKATLEYVSEILRKK